MSAPASTTDKFDKLNLETAIIHITATIQTLDVIIDYATERNVNHLKAEGCLVSTGRHLMADLEALREAF